MAVALLDQPREDVSLTSSLSNFQFILRLLNTNVDGSKCRLSFRSMRPVRI